MWRPMIHADSLRSALREFLNYSSWPRLTPSHGHRLPGCEVVLRVPNEPLPKDFAKSPKANPMWFRLSSRDERQTPPRISVFSSRFTTPMEAWRLAGSKAERMVVAAIRVRTVRKIHPISQSTAFKPLDVIWDREIDTNKPGSLGHAGITGLDSRALDPAARKSCRQQLADSARLRFL
jgi:hypothetical protein